jgi:sn-glycerol 3-phosphate transport system substrate-binding protein
MAAYEETKKSGFYESHPGREQPILQMIGKPPTENSRGVRAVNLPELRDIEDEEFEAMLAGMETAQQALDNAVRRGNAALRTALSK